MNTYQAARGKTITAKYEFTKENIHVESYQRIYYSSDPVLSLIPYCHNKLAVVSVCVLVNFHLVTELFIYFVAIFFGNRSMFVDSCTDYCTFNDF